MGRVTKPVWRPSAERIAKSNLARFMALVSARHDAALDGYEALHRFSVQSPDLFWAALWDFCGVIGERNGTRVIENPGRMPGARFFPDARLNFAENLLRRRDDTEALVFRGEDKVATRLSWRDLYDAVARLSRFLATAGVAPGDRVAAMLPNMPETIVALLATTARGGVWSSCSPDFGERGVLDRFGQIDPKVLVVCDGYWYGGKRVSIADKVARIVARLPSLERVVVVSYLGEAEALADRLDNAATFDAALAGPPPGDIAFARVGFNEPLCILYSSGTTGVPKCIVHGAGGVLLMHLKEHRLHCDLKPGDRLFYFTTCGWMMWNWLVTGLASELTLLLYDGSPAHPDISALFDYADAEDMTLFGTSAKFIDAVRKSGLEPSKTYRLSSLRTITSTGSPLAPESFDFVYRSIKSDVHLASISGGTDLCACFVLGNPIGAVWRGEIQAAGLGMDMDVFDENGRPLARGKGELVCKSPFPSMPVRFWNDPDGAKYRAAYFERFANLWCHGDFAEWTEHGGIVIHGRSDATLNPGGVRIGTAEIYAQVERMPQVAEAIAVGQDWQGDVRIVLFVRLADGARLDDALTAEIKHRIRAGASPRHVPAKVIAVADIPRTKSGKITELAVRDVVHGRAVKNREALANPEALDLFKDLAELKS